MLTCQKELFDLGNEVHYLNNAYMSPNLKAVEMAGVIAVRQKSKPFSISKEDFFKPVDELKRTFAQLINCDNHERIAIVPSASYGLSNVAKNLNPAPGSKIIIPEDQFPSNYYIWEKLVQEKGLVLEVIPAPLTLENRAQKWNEAILGAIDEHTCAVACGHVHWADGVKFDLESFREKCDKNEALLIIDGSQSVGALPFDIMKIRPDALICVGYKWLFGPYGIGFAYYNDRFDNGEPIEENWINRINSEDFKGLVNYQSMYKPFAHRYCVGENSNFINTPMMQTALQQILAWGVENIQAYSKSLIDPYIGAFENMGFLIEDRDFRCDHLLGIRVPDSIDVNVLSQKLKKHNVYVSMRGNSIRVATSVYNSKRDLDKFYAVLHEERVAV